MTRDKMDQILAAEEELAPSSGFLASVMERVREEATAPPPIPFPWKRALPGMLGTAGGLGWVTAEVVRSSLPEVRNFSLDQLRASAAFMRPPEQAVWVALAVGICVVSWIAARRVAGQSGLL